MRPVPYPIQASRLDTRFHSDPQYTQHVKLVSNLALNQRRVRKEEKWSREKELGRGNYGNVWLERCIQGDDKGSLRAVKEVKKPESGEYYRELEAAVLFSHVKYEHCFVKSLGWYENRNSIFIAMEYLPDGDLQQYLRAPLLEKEARDIIHQVIEGLEFMHDNGFTHRDLKPANLLVKCKGPDWWVKIADFGISKHVIEENTALRTLVGTPTFAAPELLGFFRPGDKPKDSYTNAVDVWSVGVIAFLILSAETPFKDRGLLNQYVMSNLLFPLDVLLSNKVSTQGCDFVKSLMAPNSENRPSVKDCLQHSWLREQKLRSRKTGETHKETNISNLSSSSGEYFEPEPSASWSTIDLISTHKPKNLINKLVGKVRPKLGKRAASSNLTSSTTNASSDLLDDMYPRSYSDQRIRDRISTDELHNMNMSADKAQPISENTINPSIPIYNDIISPPIPTLNEAGALPTPSTHESAAHLDWTLLKPLRAGSGSVIAVQFSPDGQLIATGADKTIRLWNSTTGKEIETIGGHAHSISALAFSPDETLLAFASTDNTVKLWKLDTRTTRHSLKGHSGSIYAIAFSPDRTLLASACSDKTVELWDLATRTIRHTLEGHSRVVWAVAFSSDGTLLASASGDKTVKLWDPITGMIHHTFEGHSNWVRAVVFSPDGTLLASTSCDEKLKVWDLATRSIRHTLVGHSNLIPAAAFSPDGKLLVSGSSDYTVALWDPVTGTMLQTLKNVSSKIHAVAFSPNGNMIVCGGSDGKVTIWGLKTKNDMTLTTNENPVSSFFQRILVK